MLSVSRLSLRASARPVLASARPAVQLAVPRRTILEGWGVKQPPGNIIGTVNEAQKLPAHDAVHGSYHWDFERLLAISLVPLTVLPLATGTLTPTLDALFGGLLIGHVGMGFGGCVTDYIPKRKFPRGHGVFMGLVYLSSGAALYGLYKLETTEEGLTGAVHKIWNA